MLLEWLKKDFAKDLALIRGIGAGVAGGRASDNGRSLVTFAAGAAGLLGAAGALLGDGLVVAKDDPLSRTPEPYEMSHPTWAMHWDD